MKASIEQAWERDRFKTQLESTLKNLDLVEDSGSLPKEKDVQESVNGLSWEDSVEKVCDHLVKLGRKEKTIFLAKKAFRSLKEILSPKTPLDITSEGVDKWIATLLSRPNSKDKTGKKKLNPSYVTIYIRSAKACFRWLLR